MSKQVTEWAIVVPNTPVIAGFDTREDARAFASEWAIKGASIVPGSIPPGSPAVRSVRSDGGEILAITNIMIANDCGPRETATMVRVAVMPTRK